MEKASKEQEDKRIEIEKDNEERYKNELYRKMYGENSDQKNIIHENAQDNANKCKDIIEKSQKDHIFFASEVKQIFVNRDNFNNDTVGNKNSGIIDEEKLEENKKKTVKIEQPNMTFSNINNNNVNNKENNINIKTKKNDDSVYEKFNNENMITLNDYEQNSSSGNESFIKECDEKFDLKKPDLFQISTNANGV